MLNKTELKDVKNKIKRNPSDTEIAVIDALWSENFSNKSSKKWFDLFNTKGTHAASDTGDGIIDVGDGFVIGMGIKGRHLISSIDPFHGAASEVGSTIREILSKGLEPIAILDCLRFGRPSNPQQIELLDRVISGKSSCAGSALLPNLGGDLAFADEFTDNPLVNVICVGIAKQKKIIPSKEVQPDDLLVLYGSATGSEDIESISKNQKSKKKSKSNGKNGYPPIEKLLIDATIELRDLGLLTGLTDIGRGGLSCSAVKMADRGDVGLTIDLLKVPTQSSNMTGSQILTSETQKQMLGIVEPKNINKFLEVLSKYDFQTSVIGRLDEVKTFFAHKNESLETNLPVDIIDGIPEAKRKVLKDRTKINYSRRIMKPQNHPLIEMITDYNLSSREPLYTQDKKHGKNIISSGVIKLPNNKLLAISAGGNSYMISQDIKDGAALVTLGVIRSVVCRGAVPIALVDSLNAGNPEKAGAYTELVNIIKGIAEVSHKMEIPVIGGNVSMVEEKGKRGKDKFLTSAFIGVVGLIDKKSNLVPNTLKNEPGKIYLIGPDDGFLAGSEYYRKYGGDGGEITVDYKAEKQAIELLAKLKPFISSSISVGRGGLITTLAKWSITSNIGLNYFYESEDLSFAWGEHGPRYLIQIPKNKEIQCLMECDKFETGLEITPIAQIIEEKKFQLSDGNSWELAKLKKIWEEPFEKILSK